MKRLFLLLLCAPLMLGACSDNPTEDTTAPGGKPALPAGTTEDPIGVQRLAEAVGKTGVWIEGYVIGAEADPQTLSTQTRTVPQAAAKSNILLAAYANESDASKCVRIDLASNPDMQARLNIVDHPMLVGEKIKVQGDITESAGSIAFANISAQVGGKDPVDISPEDPENPEDPEPPVTGDVELDKLYGYAEGTTGGAGATAANIHHFNDGKKFRDWLALREKNKDKTPAIAWLSGKFTKDDGRASSSPWFDIKRTSNLSIYGVNDFVMEHVGFFLNEAENIVIRNIYIKMPKADNGADGISMQESSRVWVDHCTFESINQTKDYEDGSCDITHATKQVTVSWNHFIKTQKSCLVGHSDGASADVAITATFHHNYFDLSSSRHPRVRYGTVHVYNNYFNQVSTYGVGSAYGAKVLVEDNSFKGVVLPTDICTFPAKKDGSSWVSNLTGKVAGYLYERGNEFTDKPANARDPYPFTNVEYKAYNGEKLATPMTYDDFKPAYNYVVDAAAQIATIVPSGAGVGKLQGYAQAPVEVNNGGITGPTEPTDPDPSDPEQPGGTDIGNGWTAMSSGAANATAAASGSSLTLTAQGKFESGNQTFGFVYREVTGDFVLTAQLDSYETPSTSGNQSQAGLMLTPNITSTATDFIHVLGSQGPASTFVYSNRLVAGNANRGTMTAPSANTGVKPILKLERTGDACKVSYSLDGGATFGSSKNVSISGLAEKLYVGIAANSGNTTKTATAVVNNVTLNGTPIPFAED